MNSFINELEKDMKPLLISSLLLAETMAERTIIEIYKDFLENKELTDNEKMAIKMFGHLCYFEASNPVLVDNPISKKVDLK